jgi:fatty-acyl-CoA synthase
MIKSMNIAWWVQRWSELHPQKTAIIFEEERISNLDLHRRANRTGCWLQSLGIEKGDRVAVMLSLERSLCRSITAGARVKSATS